VVNIEKEEVQNGASSWGG